MYPGGQENGQDKMLGSGGIEGNTPEVVSSSNRKRLFVYIPRASRSGDSEKLRIA